jgi:bacillolysin
MNARFSPRPGFRLTFVAVLVSVFSFQPVLASERQDAVDAGLAAQFERRLALEALGSDVTVRWGHRGSVRQVRGELELMLPARESLDDSASEYLQALRVPLGFRGDEALVNPRLSSGAHDVTFLRFEQAAAGIPVAGASLAIRYDDRGRATSISANLLIDEALPRIPVVTRAEGASAATTFAFRGASDVAAEASRLVYYLGPAQHGRLAWEVQVARRPADDVPEVYRVFVDALTGEQLASHPLIHHGVFRRVYSANNSTNYTANLLIEEGGSTSDPDGTAVYDRAGIVLAFFDSVFGRDSFDDDGVDINSTVNYLSNSNNAFFDPTADWFVYGDGDVRIGPHSAARSISSRTR